MSKDVFIANPHCPDRPMMTDAEIACFGRWVPQGGKALEFGMGGSTRFFLEHGIWQLTSIESDAQWVLAMLQDPFLQFFLRKGRLSLNHADIGPVGDFGAPLAPRPQQKWLRYHQDIWDSVPARELDIVLVDGRFRVACACQALIRCKEGTPVLFHDFWDRPRYHDILDYAEVLDAEETLAVLRRKDGADPKSFISLFEKYCLVPD